MMLKITMLKITMLKIMMHTNNDVHNRDGWSLFYRGAAGVVGRV
jgi:hypothetical protein